MPDVPLNETWETTIVDGGSNNGAEMVVNPDGTINVRINAIAVVSSANSTSTPLGSNGTFTGAFEEVKDYSMVSIMINSDQASAAGGFILDWSTDGVNIDDSDLLSFSPSLAANKQYTFGPIARYFRLRYTNGAVAQTTFRLQVMYRIIPLKPSSHRIGNAISAEADAELSKAVLTGPNETGSFVNINTTSLLGTTRLTTSGSHILLELAVINKVYSASFVVNLATGNTENRACLIRNPSGSGKNMYLGACVFDVVTKDSQAGFTFWKSPTITATGTAQTISSGRIGGSPPSSIANIFSTPTASATGTQFREFSVGLNANSYDYDFNLAVILEPGQDLLVTGNPTANNKNVSITLVWAEVA